MFWAYGAQDGMRCKKNLLDQSFKVCICFIECWFHFSFNVLHCNVTALVSNNRTSTQNVIGLLWGTGLPFWFEAWFDCFLQLKLFGTGNLWKLGARCWRPTLVGFSFGRLHQLLPALSGIFLYISYLLFVHISFLFHACAHLGPPFFGVQARLDSFTTQTFRDRESFNLHEGNERKGNKRALMEMKGKKRENGPLWLITLRGQPPLCATPLLMFSFIHSFASCTVTHGQGKPMALLTWQKTKGVNFRAPLSGVTE